MKNPLINTEGRCTGSVVAWVEAHIQIYKYKNTNTTQIKIQMQTQTQTKI